MRLTDDAIRVDLFDGRTITVPLAWHPRLLHAAPEQRGFGPFQQGLDLFEVRFDAIDLLHRGGSAQK